MDVDKEGRWGGDQRCYSYGMFRHMARHYRNPREVRGRMQETSKDQRD